MPICSEEKQKLIEEIGLYFEKQQQIPPLAARIYSLMILSENEGHTFEELMEITCASKSSVSTNLNLLVQLKNVEYFTKPGDRKRYFRSSRDYIKIALKEQLLSIQTQLSFSEKINKFNLAHNPQKFKNNHSVSSLFIEYLQNQETNLSNTINKISDL